MPVRRKSRTTEIVICMFIATAAMICVGILRGATPAPADEDPTQKKYKKVDPIATNGKIFEGWSQPDLALVFTGELDGYLEPCGCAGLDNQLGGLKRRYTFIKQLRDQGWPVIAVDAGDQEKRLGVQASQKVEFAYQAYLKMGYEAVGFGGEDLKTDMLPIVLNLNLDGANTPLVSANVGILAFDSGYTKRFRIIERGGLRIGITSVTGKKEITQKSSDPGDFVVKEPFQAIPDILPKLRNAKCDHLVLLVNSTESSEVAELASRFPEFDYVMATHGAEVPPKEMTKVPGTKANLIEVGHKGQYAVVVGFYKNGSPATRYQRVPLDHRFADAPEIYKMQTEYLHNLERLWPQSAKASWGDLGLKMTPHPTGRKFAGSESCFECHTNAAEVYEKTPHAHALETLEKRTDPPRVFDPECVSCHVTGWHPQKYFPFESGFVSQTATPELANNGCENCHGPAAKHAAAEKGDIEASEADLEKLRAELRLKVVENEGNKDGQEFAKGKVVQMCMQCHDQDNSPDFDFQKYWPKVKHEGKD